MCKFKNENGSLQMIKKIEIIFSWILMMSDFCHIFEKIIEVEGNSRLIEECAQ